MFFVTSLLLIFIAFLAVLLSKKRNLDSTMGIVTFGIFIMTFNILLCLLMNNMSTTKTYQTTTPEKVVENGYSFKERECAPGDKELVLQIEENNPWFLPWEGKRIYALICK